jgi:hypothetical protein
MSYNLILSCRRCRVLFSARRCRVLFSAHPASLNYHYRLPFPLPIRSSQWSSWWLSSRELRRKVVGSCPTKVVGSCPAKVVGSCPTKVVGSCPTKVVGSCPTIETPRPFVPCEAWIPVLSLGGLPQAGVFPARKPCTSFRETNKAGRFAVGQLNPSRPTVGDRTQGGFEPELNGIPIMSTYFASDRKRPHPRRPKGGFELESNPARLPFLFGTRSGVTTKGPGVRSLAASVGRVEPQLNRILSFINLLCSEVCCEIFEECKSIEPFSRSTNCNRTPGGFELDSNPAPLFLFWVYDRTFLDAPLFYEGDSCPIASFNFRASFPKCAV